VATVASDEMVGLEWESQEAGSGDYCMIEQELSKM
jgi:hypothetical protein